ncbi:MAG: hypothetical protein V4479_13560 [Actinomycetota bacterium]
MSSPEQELQNARLHLNEDLAQAWWRYFELMDSGEAPSDGSDYLDESTRETVDSSLTVSILAEDQDSLGKLIALLVSTATSDSQLAYIGTLVLEDAFHSMGEVALKVFRELHLPDDTRATIEGGFVL